VGSVFVGRAYFVCGSRRCCVMLLCTATDSFCWLSASATYLCSWALIGCEFRFECTCARTDAVLVIVYMTSSVPVLHCKQRGAVSLATAAVCFVATTAVSSEYDLRACARLTHLFCAVQVCRAVSDVHLPAAAETAVRDALEALDAVAPGVPGVSGVKDVVDELAARRLERQKSRARRVCAGLLQQIVRRDVSHPVVCADFRQHDTK